MATINTLPEGLKLGDRYEIIRPIGQGGMGVVYLAKDTQLDGEIRAVKTIRSELLSDPKGAVRMKREAIASMKLTHSNIIRVFNYEEWQGISYIVMEYVDGHSLAHLLAAKDTLSEVEFFPLANELMQALSYAHKQNIIHQDIKPANIFLTKDRITKLADFGIAKILNDTATRLTGKRNSGTLLYMAPEVIKGGKSSPASDIYSLGITFYEMLAGDPPFVHGDIYRLHIEAEPPEIPGISCEAHELISNMLAKDPSERFTEIAEEIVVSSRASKQPKTTLVSGPEKYKEGFAAFKANNYAKADELFQEALELDSGLASIVQPKLDICAEEIRKIKIARQAELRRSVEISRIPAYLIAAKEHFESGEWEESVDFYEKILAVDSDHRVARAGIAEISELKLKEAAMKIAQQAEADWVYQEELEAKRRKEVRRKKTRAVVRAEKERKRQEHIRKHWWKYALAIVAIIASVITANMLAEQFRLAEQEMTAFEMAQKENTISSLQEFIELYPESDRAKIASTKKGEIQAEADIAFTEAEHENTVEGWKQFLSSWPGTYKISAAQTKLSVLEEEQRQAEAPVINSMFEMVLIPSGSFMMGSSKGRSDEKPAHSVTISRAFYMGKYEVTQSQYEAVMGVNPSNFKGANNPVEKVSWDDASAFCKRLSYLTDESFRLPTEAEWEYACRAGTTTKYYWGNSSIESTMQKHAWYGGSLVGTTHEVGQKKANSFGLYDMTGNVWEWCSDLYGDYPSGPVTNPKGAQGGKDRVIRGCSWDTRTWHINSAIRLDEPPVSRQYNIGFRVVREVK